MSDNTVIQLKRSAVTGNTPDPGDVSYGEVALNYADGKLFYKNNLGSIKSIYTPNLYETVNVNGTLLVPTTATEILSLKPSNYITLSADTGSDTITISETLSTTVVPAAFNQANAANYTAEAAFIQANTINGIVSDNVATLRSEISANAYSANSVINTRISANVTSIEGYITANAASTNTYMYSIVAANISSVFAHANAAYATANSKLSSSGGTLTGSLVISNNLTVSGNLTIGGNTTTVSANNLSINDSIIYVANNNTANAVDIGIVGNFTQGIYQHTGLVRDHLDGTWKLFSNVISEPTTTVNFTGAYYDALRMGALQATSANIGGTDILVYSTSAYAHANSAYEYGTNGFNQANAAYAHANSGYALANSSIQNTGGTINGSLDVYGTITQYDSSTYSGNTTLATITQTVVTSFPASNWRTAKFTVQVTDTVSTKYHSTDILLIHDGADVRKVEYAVVTTAGELGMFDADINTGSVRLLFTATDTNSRTIKFFRTLIEA